MHVVDWQCRQFVCASCAIDMGMSQERLDMITCVRSAISETRRMRPWFEIHDVWREMFLSRWTITSWRSDYSKVTLRHSSFSYNSWLQVRVDDVFKKGSKSHLLVWKVLFKSTKKRRDLKEVKVWRSCVTEEYDTTHGSDLEHDLRRERFSCRLDVQFQTKMSPIMSSIISWMKWTIWYFDPHVNSDPHVTSQHHSSIRWRHDDDFHPWGKNLLST